MHDNTAPNEEAKITIVRKRADDLGIALPDDVVQFLAEAMARKIHEPLEVSLVRLGAYSSLTGQTITMEMAKNILRDVYSQEAHKVEQLTEVLASVIKLWEQNKIVPTSKDEENKINNEFEQGRALLKSIWSDMSGR